MYNESRFDVDFLPALFNRAGPDPSVSNRYRFMPTTDVLDALTDRGFRVVSASQGQSLSPYAKHRIYLDHPEFTPFEVTPGDEVKLRVAMFNSHNRKGRFQLHVGSFRAVCENSCVFGSHSTTSLILRHLGKPTEDFIEGVFHVVDNARASLELMRSMSKVMLTQDQQRNFATEAMQLRWKKASPVEVNDFLRPRRVKDVGDSLWLTYQRSQESLIRGGIRSTNATNQIRSVQALRSIDRDLAVNAKLWDLATTYLEAA